MRKTWKITKVE